MLIFHIVTSEHNSAFILPIHLGKLAVFEVTQLHEIAEMNIPMEGVDYNKIKDVTYNYSTSSDENSKDLIVDKILTGLIIFSVLIIWYIFS